MHRRNIRIDVSYDGTRYLGWQRLGGSQKELSIQGLLEDYLSKILNESIKIMGSGRTDAGVHAFCQVANFNTKSDKIMNEIQEELKKLLPEDIVIRSVTEVEEQFHSRYSAKSKIYDYYIDNNERESVFLRKYAYHVEKPLDIERMKEAANYLVGTHDFVSFSTERGKLKQATNVDVMRDYSSSQEGGKASDTTRTLYSISIDWSNGPYSKKITDNRNRILRIRLHGDGFLYNMVRIIVGTLVEVGLGEREALSVKEALERKTRQAAGVTIPPYGLFLREVFY